MAKTTKKKTLTKKTAKADYSTCTRENRNKGNCEAGNKCSENYRKG